MEWPLVGRREQLERIVTALASRNGGGLVLHGPAGIGKTRLLTEARDRLAARGIDVVWLLATAASQAVPFGPFAQLLPDDVDAGQPGGVMTALTARLSRPGERVALAVDDAHLLDSGAAVLLQQLVQRTRIALVVTVRTEQPAPDAVTALWKDLGLPRLGLTELDRDEVGVVLGQALGGEVSSSLTDELARLSHGNPLLLRELVAAAARSGALARRDGLWVATGPLVAPHDLPTAIADRLDRLPPRLRAAAELVALAEPVGASIVEGLLDAPVRAQLDAERLLAAVPDRRRVQVRLVHPLYTEALRATVPPLRAREHARRLAESLAETGMRRREDWLRVALWHLAAGRRDHPDLYLAAARDAHAAEDHELAAQLAEAAVDGDGGMAAELTLLRQLPFLGRLDEARARAEELAAGAATPADVVEVAVLRAHLQVVAGDPEGAQRLLAEAEAVAEAEAPELRRRVLEQLADTAHDAGDVRRAASVLAQLATGGGNHPDEVVAAARVGVRVVAMAGRPEEAVLLADRALRWIDDGVVTTAGARDEIAMARCQAVAYAGRLDRALAASQAGAAASSGGLRGAWLRDAGQALLLTGRPRSALSALREMMAELPLDGISAVSALWSLDAMAEACALVDDLAGARGYLAELKRRRPTTIRAPRTGGRVWTAAADGALRQARDLALKVAAEHADHGAQVPQAQALYDVARLGRPGDVVGDLDVLARACQGRFVPVLAHAARAQTDRDPAALEAVADAFESQGLTLFAAELAAQAGALYRRDGRPGSAFAATRRAAGLAGHCEGARTPLLADLDETGGLTERERDVAVLVAHGLSDREVAERLHLSVRTVQSHLYRIYRKLALEGRDELTRTLRRHADAHEGPSAVLPLRDIGGWPEGPR